MAYKQIKLNSISFPADYRLNTHGCTQSLTCKFKQCPRKFLLSINRWRSRKGQEKAAIGNIVHAVLAYAYQQDPLWNLPNLLDEIVHKSGKYSFIASDQLEYFKVVSFCLLTYYMSMYLEDFKTAFFTKTEDEFAVVLPNGTVLWRGKRDGEHIIKKDNSLWIREIKTRSRINEDNMLSGLQFDFQGNLYCITKDVEALTSGFIYDMIRTPQIKQRKGETLQEYSQRLMDDIKSRPSFYFMRFSVQLSPKDKASFSSELFHLERELIDFVQHGNITYKNSFSCIDGYIPCEYLDACTSGVMTNYYQTDKIFEELDCGY